MDTTSTASSSTEGPDGQGPEAGPDSPDGSAPNPHAPEGSAPASHAPEGSAPASHAPDPDRRAFFRLFGRQAVQTAAQVAGMASAVSQMPTNALTGLVGLASPQPTTPPRSATLPPSRPVATPAADASYRSPYRLTDDALVLLDQRKLPDVAEEQLCRRGSDVAYYLRVGAARGGPLMAQLAAYGLALSAHEMRDRSAESRQAEFRRVGRALVQARVGSRMLRWAVDRAWALADAHAEVAKDAEDADGADAHATGAEVAKDAESAEGAAADAGVDGAEVAARLRADADARANDAALDHATIARHLEAALPRPEHGSLHVLVHGDPGALSNGLVGPALVALANRVAAGGHVRVWVTETRPLMDGARLASWELATLDIDHVIMPDAAVGALLERERIDAVVLGGEWVAANGDVGGLVGGRVVAGMAATASGGRVPVLVTAPIATFDPTTPDGAAIPVEDRPGRDLQTYATGTRLARARAWNPGSDVIPAAWVGSIVTEMGVFAPADGVGLAKALADREAARPIAPPVSPEAARPPVAPAPPAAHRPVPTPVPTTSTASGGAD